MLSLPLAFDLVPHGIGTNAYDEEVTSCVLVELDAPAQSDFDDLKLTARQRAGRDVLADLAQTKNPVEQAAWANQLEATSPFPGILNPKSLETAMRSARDKLVDNRVAIYDVEKQLLTYVGDTEGDTTND